MFGAKFERQIQMAGSRDPRAPRPITEEPVAEGDPNDLWNRAEEVFISGRRVEVPPAEQGSSASDWQQLRPWSQPCSGTAQQFVDFANKSTTARRLRLQQDNDNKGFRKPKWGQFDYNNPHQRQLPNRFSQIGPGPGERSVLIVDNRDMRLQSPFHRWMLDV